MIFKHAISWFEIPANDIDRAQKFYETIFDISMIRMDLQQVKMRLFPIESPMNIGGALCYNSEYYIPSSSVGTVIYLNGNPDLQKVLDRVEEAGGKIVLPKTRISPDHGYMANFIDTEGNRLALHSIG